MKHVLIPVLLTILSFGATAIGDEPSGARRTRVILAQNDAQDEAAAKKKEEVELTPLPPARISITTEKPVKGIPGEIKPPSETADTGIDGETPSPGQPGIDKNLLGDDAPLTLPQNVTSTPGAGGQSSPSAPDRSGVPPDIEQVLARERAVKDAAESKFLTQEMSLLNVPTGNLRTLKFVIDDLFRLKGIVYGEEQGYIRILTADNDGNFSETWKSPPFNSPIRGVFVEDLDGDGTTEIVAYTADGNFSIYGYESNELMYRTPQGTYQNINCMVIANFDTDPQKEIFFIGVKPGTGGASTGNPVGNLIQFDPTSQFEEWTSSDLYAATDMVVGNVDTDPEMEIILNTGEILGMRMKDVKWRSTVELGSRLYLIDLDNDGILELVTEYAESNIKIIDVDLRREKW
jgi:hypothetical protein